MKSTSRKNRAKGFTLVEAVIGLLIALIISLAVSVSLRGSIKGGRTISTRLGSESSIRRTLGVASAELRSAAKAWNGANVIESASSTEVIFYANIDSDSYTERVRYTYAQDGVKKGVTKYNNATGLYDLGEKVTTVATGLTSSSTRPFLQYFGNTFSGSESDPSLTSPIDISLVKLVRMTLIPASARTNGAPDFYMTQVSLRLLKDNY